MVNTVDKIYSISGDGIRLFGVGAVMYGMYHNDIETVVGGFALIYAGSSMYTHYTEMKIGEGQMKGLKKISNNLEELTKAIEVKDKVN